MCFAQIVNAFLPIGPADHLPSVPFRNLIFVSRCSESLSLSTALNEILPYFVNFSSDLDQIWYRVPTKLRGYDLCRNWRSESHILGRD